MTIKELSRFVKESVDTLSKSDCCATYFKVFDDDFSIYVGWEDGFDEKDDSVIHSKSEPTYCICVKIAETNIACPLMDNVYMPWYTSSEEVYDTSSGVAVNEDYNALAKYYLSEYRVMKKKLKEGKITFGLA